MSRLSPSEISRFMLRRWPALLGALTLIALFFVPAFGRPTGRIVSYGKDFLHFPLFAGVAAILLFVWPKHRGALAKCAVVSGVAVSLALLIEIIQPLAGRTAAFADVLLGTAGSFAVVAVYLALRSASDRARRWLIGTGILLLLASGLPLGLVIVDRLTARSLFPMIDSFERPVDLGRWKPEGGSLSQVEEHATHGRYAMRLTVEDPNERYPGLLLADGRMDWRAHRRLAFDVYLEASGSRKLWVRLDDRMFPPFTDRAQTELDVKPGANRIVLDLPVFAVTPTGRPLDLDRIEAVGIFLDGAQPGDALFLDFMTLSGRVSRPASLASPR